MAESVSVWSRQRLQTRLDEIVRENRFTIAVVFPVVGAALLVASAEGWLPPLLAFNPYLILLGTLVMRLPLIAGAAPLIGRREAIGIGALTAYAYGIELLGVTTGWPYGDFSYGIDLGPMLFGEVPLGLPVFFLPLVLNSYLLATLVFGERAADPRLRLPAVIGTVLAVDLVLDPAAVSLGFWTYGGGVYYGVPLSNYAGWALSATVSVLVIDAAVDRRALIERVRACEFMLDDLVSFVLLWGAINLWFGNWIAVAVAGLFFAALVRIGRFDFAVVGGRR